MSKPTYKELEKKVTDLKKKLQKYELQQLWNIFYQSPIPTLISSKDGRFVKYNVAMAELTGYIHEEVPDIGAWMLRLYPDEKYRSKVKEIATRSINKKIDIKRDEFIITRKDSEQRYVAFSVYDIFHGRKPTDLQVVQGEDITELKRAEEALQSSQERYRLATYAVKVGVWDWNIETGEFYLDPIIKDILGYTDEEIPNDLEVWVTYVHQDDKEPVMEAAQAYLEGKTPEYVFEHRMMHKDGSIRWVDVHGKVIRDEKGNAVRMVGTDTDITERKKVEEKLKLTQKELKIKAKNLEETNTAMKVLLKHQDTEKEKLEKNILTSLKTLVLPYLEKIKIGTSDERQKTYVNIIETNLSEITKPFASKLTAFYSKLTPTEMQITNLIRENKTAKDIAKILDISVSTVFFHRENIRIKLGLKNKKTNLQTYLQSIPND